MESVQVFSDKFQQIIKNTSIKSICFENCIVSEENEKKQQEAVAPQLSITDTLSCSICRIEFNNHDEQRKHYKLDWHRYNLHQALTSKSPLTESEFDEKIDISSISGSETDSDDLSNNILTASGQICLQNDNNQVFKVYTCLISNKRDDALNEINVKIRKISEPNAKWTILMVGGGHFAGVVFQANTPIFHKTYHCYTVRAGQGGSQSARDGKSGGGSTPKSAGATLRRYNEQALNQHIAFILKEWKKEIEESALIFYRASGPYNRSLLFDSHVLDKNDIRLRTIPFSTRRPTFAEVKRVHGILTQANLFLSLEDAKNHFQVMKNQNNSLKLRSKPNRSKSRESVAREFPIINEESSSDQSDTCNVELSYEFVKISTIDLQEFDNSIIPKQIKNINRKKNRKSKTEKLKEAESKRCNNLIDLIATDNVEMLSNFLATPEEFNQVVDNDGNSLLHVAALNESVQVLVYLLDNNANPCTKNKKYLTPYSCTQARHIRDLLKQFACNNPNKYNYNKASIPINLQSNEEQAEKKKQLKKMKKIKEKLKKQELQLEKQEQIEKERYLKLSDREKMALAAERRLLNQTGQVIARCFLCASDISGKVPFEYMGNRFCSIDCLKAHRIQHSMVLL